MACSSCNSVEHRKFSKTCPHYYSDAREENPIEPDMSISWDFASLAESFELLNYQQTRRRTTLIDAMRKGTFAWQMLEQWFDGRCDPNGHLLVAQGGGSQGPDLISGDISYEIRSVTINSLNLRPAINTGGQRAPTWRRGFIRRADYYVFIDRTYFPEPMPVYFVDSRKLFHLRDSRLLFIYNSGSGETTNYRLARLLIRRAKE